MFRAPQSAFWALVSLEAAIFVAAGCQGQVTDMAGIGARALLSAGRDADADAFWEKYGPGRA